jgi:hypothetical protein
MRGPCIERGMNMDLFLLSHSARPVQIVMIIIVSVPKKMFIELPFHVKIFTYI